MVSSVAVQIAIRSGGEKEKKNREGVSESLVKAPVSAQSISRAACYPDHGGTAQILWWE